LFRLPAAGRDFDIRISSLWGYGMRIISGTSKGKRLATPKSQALRPTSDRVKESIFNILGGVVEGKVVLDLFAGTGNLGIEALSRGAQKTFFVEKGSAAIRLIKKNLYQCRFMGHIEIIPKDVNRAIGILYQRGEIFDLIMMDPPYQKGLIQRTLDKLQSHKIYHNDTILMIEHDRREPLPTISDAWKLIRQRRIGDTVVSFLMPEPPADSNKGVLKK
jgi:16S rRNA (guanine(966)-N(2))-methyltransferase RsmD